MKKLIVLSGLIFCILASSTPSKSASMDLCFGFWVSVRVTVCHHIYVTHDLMDEKCYDAIVSVCAGRKVTINFGIVAIDIPDFSDPSTYITQDVIINDFEFEDGSVSDIIIPAGEEAVLDETDGLYYTNYYIYNN